MSSAGFSNDIFDNVISFIEYTNQNIFLTGKAGTGKTTLLRKIKETSTKKTVIVAPTGVAAMNAKGVTINSLFQLPPGSFFPGDVNLASLQAGIVSINSLISELSYTKERKTLFTELELMIIDEVSMVRCDVLDALDAILKSVRNNPAPFGGVQLLLIGDLFQLPPVTKREDWDLLSRAYPSPYFFDSRVIKQNPVLLVELKKVFRQTEPEFVDILNDIRNNQINDDRLALLNQRLDPDFKQAPDSSHIIITSHNSEANTINNEKLSELEGEEHIFEGQIDGAFKEQILPVDQSLKLKEGAQIMFIKNDTGENRKFFNGKIGKVKSIRGEEIYISFPEEEDLLLERSSWQSFEYKANDDEAIVQQLVGEFFQFPIKLAWAVTIHKSQGLTFDSAIIDAGKSFISGQVYVALSRVRTLNGLILKSKINKDSLRSNTEVIQYMKSGGEDEDLSTLLSASKEKYIIQLLAKAFSFNEMSDALNHLLSDADVVKSTDTELRSLVGQLNRSTIKLQEVAVKFQFQLVQLQKESGLKDYQMIYTRMEAAHTYFSKEISLQLLNQVNKQIRNKAKSKPDQKITHLFQQYRLVLESRLFKMRSTVELAAVPENWTDHLTIIGKIRELLKKKMDTPAAAQNATTLQLF